MRVSWAASEVDYSLQRSANVGSGYSCAGLGVVSESDQRAVYDTILGGAAFYRALPRNPPYDFDNTLGNNQWGYAANWNPDGTPGPCDETIIQHATTVFVVADSGAVDCLTVGKTSGNGSLNLYPGGSVTFLNLDKSVIIGGASAQPVNFYRHGLA